jgi:hypothetical protein
MSVKRNVLMAGLIVLGACSDPSPRGTNSEPAPAEYANEEPGIETTAPTEPAMAPEAGGDLSEGSTPP